MKTLLLGFIVIIFAASLVPTRAPASPTHYSPYKKQWYKEFKKPEYKEFQITITQDIIDNDGDFVFPRSIRELSCEVCNHTWDTSNWSIIPLIRNKRILFCSSNCRKEWQISRRVK